MANEKKMGAAQVEEEKVPTAVEATEQTEGVIDAAPEIEEGAEILTSFVLERKDFVLNEGEKNEKKCYDYVVNFGFPTKSGVKPMDVHFVPSDVAGFGVLDLIYSFPDADALFILRPWSIKADKKRGIEASSGYSYIVRCSELEALELKVRPAKESDKALAKAMLSLSGYKVSGIKP